MWAVLGLGNPGRSYRGTRHNVGFNVLDAVARELGVSVRRRKLESLVAEAVLDGEVVVLAKPQTFMNLSGVAARALTEHYGIPAERLLVVCDDINLPLGRIRIRAAGSHGGHNGLKSITAELGTQRFPRVRVGIGDPGCQDVVSYVLSRFLPSELAIIEEQVQRATAAVLTILKEGVEAAMNRFNAKPQTVKGEGEQA
ncbi:MAG: aminoacyl-tRNA hydrolase [Armatimonadota bacterium]